MVQNQVIRKIHHLNCATLCPVGGLLINGPPARMVCHCLLLETNAGLVLVDTGLGARDIEDATRLPAAFRKLTRPVLDPAETALAQVNRLGFNPADVRHIALTHLDVDHAGGIADFPRAAVHVFADEHRAAVALATAKDRLRYGHRLRRLEVSWKLYEPAGKWFGLDCAGALEGLSDGVVLVSLKGHSAGHAGVAVRDGKGWLLHAGDAFFYWAEMDLKRPRCTAGLELHQRVACCDHEARIESAERLRELLSSHGSEVRLFCAHDPTEFEQFSRPPFGSRAVL
ncbi:MAG: MBL fold metallo-hydrolase [Deltaproteobacteria bacterium]|nr:MBL fold metallo-hydrolase [Deltaproteobacteria bacterium]